MANALWDTVRNVTGIIGTTAQVVTNKTKLKADIFLVDREIAQRQHLFGMQLYDYVEPLSRNPNFFAADDILTETIRPSLIVAQREIAALDIKRRKQNDKISLAKANRAAAFPTPAVTWQEKLGNVGKSTVMATSEVQLQTRLSFIEQEIKNHKQTFGINLFAILEDLEDKKGWLPTDREIRSIYDNCRRDIEKLRKKKILKEEQLEEVDEVHGGGNNAPMGTMSERGTRATGTYNTPGLPAMPQQQQPQDQQFQYPPPSPSYNNQQQQQQQQQMPPMATATPVPPDQNNMMSLYGNNNNNIHSSIGDTNSNSMFSTTNTTIHDAVAAAGGSSSDAYAMPQQQQQQQQQQPQYPDPFSNLSSPQQQQQQQQPQQQPQFNSNWMNQANPFARPGTENKHDDPFAGIGSSNNTSSNNNNNNGFLWD